jgi:hypothetical protein
MPLPQSTAMRMVRFRLQSATIRAVYSARMSISAWRPLPSA